MRTATDELHTRVKKCIQLLSKQQTELYGSECAVIDIQDVSSSTDFLFTYMKQNRPVVIKNVVNDWPALTKWVDNSYLIEKLGDRKVSVAASPNGRVDAVHEQYFVEPEIRQMTLEQFFNSLSNEKEVLYIQQQNGNLFSEFDCLLSDIDLSNIQFFSQNAFHTDIDAANIWIGTENSVSSAHKDHYENLYVQVCGTKIFYLLPPSTVTQLDIQMYKRARFEKQYDSWNIVPNEENSLVPWISMDLRKEYELVRSGTNPNSSIRPIRVELNPGDLLYLPSLWYHQVEQANDSNGRVVAVNFWYDMVYDQNYYYYQFLENLVSNWKEEIIDMELADSTEL